MEKERQGIWQTHSVAADMKHALSMERILGISASQNGFLPG